MIFKRLYLKNFLSVGDSPVEFTFPSEPGITLIRGINHDVSKDSSNGAGKSSIIEGILFAFYAKTLRKLNTDGVMHNNATEECHIELEYDNVKIVRYIRKKKNRYENKAELFVDGVSIGTDASVTEVNKEIANVLKINFETMCNILIFGQHNMISFLDAGEPEKREIVENLMNLAEYNAYEDKAKTLLRETRTKLKVLQEAFIQQSSHFESHNALKIKQLTALASHRELISAEIKALTTKLSQIPDTNLLQKQWDDFTNLSIKRKTLEEELTALHSQKNTLVEQQNLLTATKASDAQGQSVLEDRLSALRYNLAVLDTRKRDLLHDQLEPINLELESLRSAYIELETKKSNDLQKIVHAENWNALLSTATLEIDNAQNEYDAVKFKKLDHNAICHHCYGQIDVNNASNYLAHKKKQITSLTENLDAIKQRQLDDILRVEKEKQQIDMLFKQESLVIVEKGQSLKADKERIEAEIQTTYKTAVTQISANIAETESSIAVFIKELDAKYHKQFETIQCALIACDKKIVSVTISVNSVNPIKPAISVAELAQLQADANADRRLLAEKQKSLENNPYAEMLDSIEHSICETNSKIAATKKEIDDFETLVPCYEYWVTAFGKQGIKSFVIDQIIPTLNEQIDYWMQIIYQGFISVRFDKLLNVKMVNNSSRSEMIFGQGSGGERRRIDIAIMLAFRQIMQMSTGKNPNVCYFDESVENLDEEGVNGFYEALQDIAKTVRVYVITHNTHLLNLLSKSETLLVEKTNGAMTVNSSLR
jgi:DNA repair exonuclease SbcCD ATPase subunit